MIRLQLKPPASVADAIAMLQTAIGVEFGTLPPYMYAMNSIPPGKNPEAASRIKSVFMQEMIHFCLACNILNALGGDPVLTAPVYPGPLPGDVGDLRIHLFRLSEEAMAQGMAIEKPETVPDYPVKTLLGAAVPAPVTIGQFYEALDAFLATLPAEAWIVGRHQIADQQFFTGQLFAVNSYADASRAIHEIVSEGEGAKDDPLDFQQQIAHYYRFGEVFYDRVLTDDKTQPNNYTWGPQRLGVDWSAVYPAIPDPSTHDFSKDPPAAQAAQLACNQAFSVMVRELQRAVTGEVDRLGVAVRAMFELRMAAMRAFMTPLADPAKVAGPAFIYLPESNAGGST